MADEMVFDRDDLEEMTANELREICENMGIEMPGLNRKRASALVEIILAAQEPELAEGGTARAVKAQVTAVADGDEPPMARIRVSCGASSDMFDVVGSSVGEVAGLLQDALNIDLTAQGVVNGQQVGNDHILEAGDELEFLKTSGRKG